MTALTNASRLLHERTFHADFSCRNMQAFQGHERGIKSPEGILNTQKCMQCAHQNMYSIQTGSSLISLPEPGVKLC